ncbi:MAG TPA: serine hydrolase [Blastocatellia bacterium]|nr:serine hydrolase [Blastocatellia bacterium]
MKVLSTFLLLLSISPIPFVAAVSNQPASSAARVPAGDVQDEIKAVENGLLPSVVARGERGTGMTIADRMAHYRVPAVSIAVIKDYKIEWAKGYGKLAVGDDTSVTPETLFQAASISKPVASMATLHFVQDGKLNLDENVNDKLTSWKVPENDFTRQKKITLRELMSHSAGMTVSGFGGYAAGQPIPTVPEVLDGKKPANSAPVRVDWLPGSKWVYSGGGITVMQQLLVDVIHHPFPEIMKETVLDKIGMSHSTYEQPLPEKWRSSAAAGHYQNGNPIEGKWHTYPEMAAAGLWTTPSDLARFAIELSKEYMGQSSIVLSREMARGMLAVQIGKWGLGVGVEGQGKELNFSHSGGNAGFRCNLICFPETGSGAVIMTNSDNGFSLYQEILRSIAAEYGWSGYAPRVATVVMNPNRLDSYVGGYSFKPGFEVDVERADGHLFASVDGGTPSELLPVGDEEFLNVDDGADLLFNRTDINQVIGLTLHAFGQEFEGKKVK